MTRLYLAAGVAALAIAAPATAGPGGHGGGGQHAHAAQQGGNAAHAQRAQAPRVQRQQAQRVQRAQAPRTQRQSAPARQQRVAAVHQHVQRTAPAHTARATHVQQAQSHQQVRGNHGQQAQARQQVRVQHAQKPQQARAVQQAQNRQQMRAERMSQVQNRGAQRQQMQASRGLAKQDRMAGRQVVKAERAQAIQQHFAERSARSMQRLDQARAFAPVPMTLRTRAERVLPVGRAVTYVGQPISTLGNVVALSAFPTAIQYYYPNTPDYYYQYGDGYGYQINRGTNLISALIPLLAGGFMPGQYLPAAYMNSYAPDNYGFNSFYPARTQYGCNRYYNGVVYRVDCVTGMIENVVPLYAGGYGVGQMIPSSYDYYNVPYQYRSIYPASASSGYWYAPGAIYQYDQRSSLITSVAALLSPGMSIGQPLPMGYNTYNVPYAYRSQYYDTPNAWYRYNNGYIYQVDPATQLVSAIVASILT
jgi:hypothetical protein